MEKRRYPVGTQTFSKIVEGNYVYVDKTALVYKLVKEYEYVFLSRPRRFGKSLLCSTLKEYFEGNKKMFNGLQMAELEKDWVKYPVIHLDFSDFKSDNIEDLKDVINNSLRIIEEKYSVEQKASSFSARLQNIVLKANESYGQKAVIIIDEYDAPMLNTIDNDSLQNQVRTIMNDLFSSLKKLDSYLRFVFITGITKFSQMSIFSALNNLKDISLMPEFEAICGISKDELFTQLKDGLQNFADKNNLTFEQTLQVFKFKYDGYHFSIEMQDVFNPYSVINALNDKMPKDYWFDSGTPSSLLKLISKFNLKMEDFDNTECVASRFNQPVEKVTDLIPFLFQSGYLTIKNYRSYFMGTDVVGIYTLGYPNGEVRTALADSLFRNYYKVNDSIALRTAYVDFMQNDDIDTFIEHIKIFFDGFPFSMNNEKENELHYHSILYTVLTSFGADVAANQETALGKADLVLKMPKTIYVIEIKYNMSTDAAMKQIKNRRYAKAYLDSGKRIVKLAINFSSKDRNIESYEAEEEKIN